MADKDKKRGAVRQIPRKSSVKGKNVSNSNSQKQDKSLENSGDSNSGSKTCVKHGRRVDGSSKKKTPVAKPKRTLAVIKEEVKKKQVDAVTKAINIAKANREKRQQQESLEAVSQSRAVEVAKRGGSTSKKSVQTSKKPQQHKGKQSRKEDNVSSESDVDESSENEADKESSSDEDLSDADDVASQVRSIVENNEGGVKTKSKFREKELTVLLKMCFKYYKIIEGNLSSAPDGLSKEKKDETWKLITEHVNRFV